MLRLLVLCACGALFTACDVTQETPNVGQAGSPEAIPELQIVLTPATVADRVTIPVTGLDQGSPTVALVTLKPGTTYSGVVVLDNAIEAEIKAEAESHLFTYTASSDSLTIRGTDRESLYAVQNLNDGDYLLGTRFTLVTSAATAGTITVDVRLRHFEGAPKTGSDDQGGTEDVAFTIPVQIGAPASGS